MTLGATHSSSVDLPCSKSHHGAQIYGWPPRRGGRQWRRGATCPVQDLPMVEFVGAGHPAPAKTSRPHITLAMLIRFAPPTRTQRNSWPLSPSSPPRVQRALAGRPRHCWNVLYRPARVQTNLSHGELVGDSSGVGQRPRKTVQNGRHQVVRHQPQFDSLPLPAVHRHPTSCESPRQDVSTLACVDESHPQPGGLK